MWPRKAPKKVSVKTLSHSKKQTTGDEAEKAAKTYLEKQGLLFIESNYRCKLGEIDLIMREKTQLVFVEVRYRKQTNFGSAVETINQRKQKKVINTAHFYLQNQHSLKNLNCRFDVIGVTGTQTAFEFQWISNAFDAF